MNRKLLSSILAAVLLALTASPANAQPPPADHDFIEIPYELAEPESAEPGEFTPFAAAVKQYGPCTLKIHFVHLRKSGRYGTVGFKSETNCSKQVTSIKHESDLRAKGFLHWKKIVGGQTSIARNSKRHLQKSLQYACKGKSNTTFAGTTLGTIVYKGKTYYARSYSETARLPCKA